jgi:hypothetical protein
MPTHPTELSSFARWFSKIALRWSGGREDWGREERRRIREELGEFGNGKGGGWSGVGMPCLFDLVLFRTRCMEQRFTVTWPEAAFAMTGGTEYPVNADRHWRNGIALDNRLFESNIV